MNSPVLRGPVGEQSDRGLPRPDRGRREIHDDRPLAPRRGKASARTIAWSTSTAMKAKSRSRTHRSSGRRSGPCAFDKERRHPGHLRNRHDDELAVRAAWLAPRPESERHRNRSAVPGGARSSTARSPSGDALSVTGRVTPAPTAHPAAARSPSSSTCPRRARCDPPRGKPCGPPSSDRKGAALMW